MNAQHPEQIRIANYTYELPDSNIARFPLADRDQSRLLIYQNGNLSERKFFELAEVLPKPSALYFNNSKVVPARIIFTTREEKSIEIFLIEPAGSGYAGVFQSQGSCRWQVMIGGLKKWKREESIRVQSGTLTLEARYLVPESGGLHFVEFSWKPEHLTWAEVLEVVGKIPLPPYLKREAVGSDAQQYQTVYAKAEGSVAAPTAGLHFTDRLLDKLSAQGIAIHELTLHVSSGTFKPVKSETLAGHEMHGEWIEVSLPLLENLLKQLEQGIPIIAVGTTVLRVLESVYWMGVKLKQSGKLSMVQQWDPYRLEPISAKESLLGLKAYFEQHQLTQWTGKTALLIAPPYPIKMANALITNFHQPQSTLLLLVASVVGEENWRSIYDYALAENFRFLSYGDSSLLFIS